MILKIDDWEFDIDLDRTMEYSAAEAADHCTCAYCRNYYAAIDDAYPELRPFLAQFGLDVNAPDELLPYDFEGNMHYDGVYMVSGRILRRGEEPFFSCRGLEVTSVDEAHMLHISHSCPKPCFPLDVGTAVLPWVLDEPMEETISPANEPSFLKKMWDRLLGRVPKSNMES